MKQKKEDVIIKILVNYLAYYCRVSIRKLATVSKGNSEFCFPETLNVPGGEAEGCIEGQRKTKVTVFLEASVFYFHSK